VPDTTSQPLPDLPASDGSRATPEAATPDGRTADRRRFITEFLAPLLPASQNGSARTEALDRWLTGALADGPSALSLPRPASGEGRRETLFAGSDSARVRVRR